MAFGQCKDESENANSGAWFIEVERLALSTGNVFVMYIFIAWVTGSSADCMEYNHAASEQKNISLRE